MRRRIGDAPFFALHGGLNDMKFVTTSTGERIQISYQDLSQGIIDILDVHRAGKWHIPSEEEYAASGAAEGAYLDWLAGVPKREPPPEDD